MNATRLSLGESCTGASGARPATRRTPSGSSYRRPSATSVHRTRARGRAPSARRGRPAKRPGRRARGTTSPCSAAGPRRHRRQRSLQPIRGARAEIGPENHARLVARDDELAIRVGPRTEDMNDVGRGRNLRPASTRGTNHARDVGTIRRPPPAESAGSARWTSPDAFIRAYTPSSTNTAGWRNRRLVSPSP